jgi:hypothetical protein
MGTQVLIDNFAGNPDEFYSLVIEEINLRELPDKVEYRWVEEAESDKRLFNKGDKAKALQIVFKTQWMVVFAYPLGKTFFVSARVVNRFHDPETTTYLYDVIMHGFETVVERSTKKALARHMENKQAPIPKFLAANDNDPLGQEASN